MRRDTNHDVNSPLITSLWRLRKYVLGLNTLRLINIISYIQKIVLHIIVIVWSNNRFSDIKLELSSYNNQVMFSDYLIIERF